jgi:hypothetical protein
MDSDDRVSALESAVQVQNERFEALNEKLKQLLERLGSIPDPQNPPRIESPAGLSATTESLSAGLAATVHSRLKPGVPSDFDGDRSKGRAFLNSCDLYIRLCPQEFIDDQAKVHWVLSYMKSDRAATFADRVLRQEAKTNLPRFGTWRGFRAVFIDSFCPENEATYSLLRLESERYFQGRRTVEAYIDEFEQLVDLSGYTEALVVVLKFRRGLNPAIQDKIAELGRDRPADNDADAWYAAARRYDQNRLANEAFHMASSKRATAPTSSAPASRPQPSRFNFAPIAAPIAAPRPAPVAQPLSQGVPMDIDAQRARVPPPSCHRCGKPGHFKRECPLQYDIRHMCADEHEDAIQALLAQKDAVSDESEPVAEEEKEDFQRRSE